MIAAVFTVVTFLMSRFQDFKVDALLLRQLYRQKTEETDDSENLDATPKGARSRNHASQSLRDKQVSSQSDDENKQESDNQSWARDAFKSKVEATSDFDLRYIAHIRDVIAAFLYSFCCRCCCCCASDKRGPASCKRRSKNLQRFNLAA